MAITALLLPLGLAGTSARADDVLQLMPFETFTCSNENCPIDFVESGGQDAAALGRVAKARSRAGAFGQTRKSDATVGLRFQVCEATQARIVVRGSYSGKLRGTGGGNITLGRMEVSTVLHDLTDNEIDDRARITLGEEKGKPLQTVTSFHSSFNFPSPLADITGAVVTADLEPGHIYMAGLELRTEGKGTPPRGLADVKNDPFQSELFLIEIELTPDLPDSDGDGLFDVWEEEGIKDCEGNVIVDLPAFGADPDKKDVFVEYDWLPGAEPTRADIDFIKERFAAAPGDSGVDRIANPDDSKGINVWIDTGSLSENGILVGDDFGGGDQISLADVPNGQFIPRVGGDADGNDIADFREVKDIYFDKARRAVFHYGISGPSGPGESGPPVPGVSSCNDGVDNDGDGLVDGDDSIDCFGGGQAAGGANFFVSNADAGTFLHELGHTLGLGHGGIEGNNCKPNYLSIMNYVYAGGVPRDDDGDGVFENRSSNLSPLPLDDDNRARAPLDDLIENQLDESAIVDDTDPVHAIRWVDANGIGRSSAINAPVNWDGNTDDDGNPIIEGDVNGNGVIDEDENLVEANLNRGDENGSPSLCEANSAADGHPSNETLRGAHDWYTMVFRFTPDSVIAGDAVIDVIDETGFDPIEVEGTFNATDLVVEKTVDPDPWVGGQTLTYAIDITNKGPNGAADVDLIDMPPDGVQFVDLPEGCKIDEDGALRCDIEPLSVGETVSLELDARMPLVTDCGRNQFTFLSNQAAVINNIGNELMRGDNVTTARHALLCPMIEYPVKFICGVQDDPDELGLLSGGYGTAVNLHNPQDEEVFVFAKLALARPAEPFKPGPVMPIDLLSFAYDEALTIDCDMVRDRLFEGVLPDGLIDGFLVLQSARSLDVTAVHTTALLDEDGKLGSQTSIDVERIEERRREPPKPKADLVLTLLASDLVCDSTSVCDFDVRYQIENIGDADTGAFMMTVADGDDPAVLATDPWDDGMPKLASEIRPFSLKLERAALEEGVELCLRADLPDNLIDELDETNNIDCRLLQLSSP